MHPLRTLAAAAVVLGMAAPFASAQTVYRVVADAQQENPQTTSTNTGEGTLFFNPISNELTYDITITGVTGSFTGAHIHVGSPGSNGGIVTPLVGGPPTFQGSTILTATQAGQLAAGDLYANIHSSTFPGGEIRGQIVASLTQLVAVANGAKETPPNGSTGTATGTFNVNPDNSLTYAVSYSGLGSNITACHIHNGKPGQAGGIVSGLQLSGASGTSGSFSGTTLPLSDGDVASIRAGQTYLNVHSAGLPGGEVRGQVVASFTEFSTGCNGAATLSGAGLSTPGQSIALTIANGTPNASPGLLFVGGIGAEINFAFACNLAMQPSPLVTIGMPALDGSGGLTLPLTIPPVGPIASPLCLPLQYFGADAGQPGGYFNTNGLQLCIDD